MYGERVLEGKRALIVGAGGGGIGSAVTESVARAGADVALVDISAQAAEEAAQSVRDAGRRAVTIVADVNQQSEIDRIVAETVAGLGGLDVLVPIIGGFLGPGGYARTHEVADADWDLMQDFNLRYAFRVTRAALAQMLAQGQGGTIVAINSIASRSYPLGVAYGVSKAGLLNLTKSVAVEYARDGIRMNAVTLGVILTAKGAAAKDAPNSIIPQDIEEAIPLGRWGRPQEVANAVVFLASPLSSYTTGHEILIDGGASVRVPLRLHGTAQEHIAG